jgi:hypothetical protein
VSDGPAIVVLQHIACEPPGAYADAMRVTSEMAAEWATVPDYARALERVRGPVLSTPSWRRSRSVARR